MLNRRQSGGVTPLSVAVIDGEIEIVDLLLKYGADINTGWEYGDASTALDVALFKLGIAVLDGTDDKDVRFKVIQHLDKHGAKTVRGCGAVVALSEKFRAKELQELISGGASSNESCENGRTPIMAAAESETKIFSNFSFRKALTLMQKQKMAGPPFIML